MSSTALVLLDGRSGHERQALALAGHITQNYQSIRVQLDPPWHWLAPTPTVGMASNEKLQQCKTLCVRHQPKWIISCGRRSAQIALHLKHQQSKSGETKHAPYLIQILNPRRHIEQFDLIITPHHDPISGPNIINTLGAIHSLNQLVLEQARQQWQHKWSHWPRPWYGVLLGGGGMHQLKQQYIQLQQAIEARSEAQCSVLCTTSRRTPNTAAKLFRQLLNKYQGFVHCQQPSEQNDTPGQENPYLGILSCADRLWVSADSVNMICESLTTSKPIHLLGHSARKSHLSFINKLNELNLIQGELRQNQNTTLGAVTYPPRSGLVDINGQDLAAIIDQRLP